jgi:hypothetical protein
VPYIITFTKSITPSDSEQYINDCCIGGDVVLDRLLPALRERYGDELESCQEDWGWFVSFKHSTVKLAVDIHTHDAEIGQFQLHLTSRTPRWMLSSRVEDTAELETLRDVVVTQLRSWPAADLLIERVDKNYR